ncbi:SixA phosphatase family protein [Nocardiopsis sp. LOL_012]|uniref:SixA phosphatase family protein n=1 Tax=Nocardiopsis sp. LOL_012 TaxID=3345409 RepID=UPI003A88AA84
MSRTLLLMRHAKAEPGHGAMDIDRALADRGRRHAEEVGRLLAERGYVPDHVLCSAALRTRQTLDGVLRGMGEAAGRLEVDYSEAAYLAGTDALLEMITYVDPQVRTLLVVGHNPTIARLAAAFVGEDVLVSYPPGTVSAVELDVEWLYTAPGTGAGTLLN